MTSPGQHSKHREAVQAEQVPPHDRTAAIMRLLPSGAQKVDADRFESFAHENQIPLDWFWTIRNASGQPSTCLLAVPSPGRTAMLFTSQVTNDDQEHRLTQLLDHGVQHLQTNDVDLAQALLVTTDRPSWKAYEKSGFQELALLQYMEMPVPKRVTFPVVPSELQLVQYDESMRSQLAEALDSSYENTLDCPALRGLRETDDVITGHQSTGRYNEALWSIALHDGMPVGAVLINESNRDNQAELVYIGLACKVRGKGWGRILLQHGVAQASRAKRQRLSLAVDIENKPALTMYSSMGFVATGKRQAVIRSTRALQEG